MPAWAQEAAGSGDPGASAPVNQTNAAAPAAAAASQAQVVSSGTHILDAGALAALTSLSVLQGATAIIDFSNNGSLVLPGDFSNAGTVYAVSSNTNVATANLSAAGILNQTGGLVTTVLPQAGLPGLSNLLTSLNLSLFALNDIVNSGTISSAGNLTMTAGGSITNNAGAVMSAINNVSIASQMGNIVNAGLIASQAANVNFATAQMVTGMNINNAGGSVQALMGAINVRDTLFSAKAASNLSGGDWLSRELNINSGEGAAEVDVESISGRLNISAGVAHTIVHSGELHLGDLSLSGDPTFYNNSGNISIDGNISGGEALALVAKGNITSSGDFSITANNGSSGFDITMVAGADISTSSSTASPAVAGALVAGEWIGTGTPADNTVTVNGASSTGGDIDFSNRTMTISSAAVASGSAGGNVRLIAYHDSGSGTSGGHVLLSSASSISTAGSGSGANGNVTILAGAMGSGSAITTGTISATGGSGGTSTLSVRNAQPAFSIGTSLTFGTNGAISSGNDFTAGTTGGGDVVVSGNVSAKTSATLLAGTNLSRSGSVTVTAPTVTLTATTGNIGTSGTELLFGNGGSGASLFVSAPAGSAFLLDSSNESVTLLNTTSPLNAAVAFVLSSHGNMLVTTAANTAITSPSISLTATGGNISADGAEYGLSNPSHLKISSGGTSGLSLFTKATTVSSAGGAVAVLTTNNEAVTLANGTVPLSASVAFTMQNQGSLQANTDSNTAITSPLVRLTMNGASGGSGTVGGNAAATTPLLINNGGSGLGLFLLNNTSGVVRLSDNASESVTLINDLSPAFVNGSFYLAANGNILASVPANTAVTSPLISLTALGGNITADGTAGGSALRVRNGGAVVTLFASATKIGSVGGTANFTSVNSVPVTLLNSTGALNAGVSFTLTASGNIGASVPGSTAISSPSVSLTATGGNITADGTTSGSALLVNSGGTSGLTVFVNATTVSSAGGTVNLSDTNTQNVLLSNGTSALNADASFTLSAVNSITASVVANTAITSPTITLSSSARGIGGVGGNAVIFTATILNLSAPNTSNGDVFVRSTNNTFSFGTVTVGRELEVTVPGNLNISLVSSFSVPRIQLQTVSGGNIIVDANLTATTFIHLFPDGSILRSGSFTLSSPSIVLQATLGNVGAQGNEIRISSGNSGGTQLQLSATASANTANNGNVYITDGDADISSSQPALRVITGRAGSGTPVDNTTGNLQMTTSAGGIQVRDDGDLNATTAIQLSAHTNIVQELTVDIAFSPSYRLTATTGDIGSAGTPFHFDNNGAGVSLYANAAGGSVYVDDNVTEAVTLSNSSSASSAAVAFTMATKGNILASVPGNTAISSPSVSLTATGGNITDDGTTSGSALLVNSGGTSGLGLSVTAGGSVKLSDSATETVTLGTSAVGAALVLEANSNIVTTGTVTALDTTLQSIASIGNITVSGSFNASTLFVEAHDIVVSTGATLTSNGQAIFNLLTGGTFTNNGMVRNTSASTLLITSTPGQPLVLAGTGTFRQDAASPSYTAFFSDTSIQFAAGTSLAVNSSSTSTMAPFFMSAPLITASSPVTVTTDGGAYSVSNLGASNAITFSGGSTMNFNGGPFYVQNASVTVNTSTTIASNNLVGVSLVGTPSVLTNNGTIKSTYAGYNIYLIGSADLEIRGTLGNLDSTGGSVAVVSPTKVTFVTTTQRITNSDTVYISAPTVALNASTLQAMAPSGSTFVISSPSSLNFNNTGSSTIAAGSKPIYVIPAVITNSINITGTGNIALNGNPVFFLTSSPGSTTRSPSVTLSSTGTIGCGGNCNNMPLFNVPVFGTEQLIISIEQLNVNLAIPLPMTASAKQESEKKQAGDSAFSLKVPSIVDTPLPVTASLTPRDTMPIGGLLGNVSQTANRMLEESDGGEAVVRGENGFDDETVAQLSHVGVKVGGQSAGNYLVLDRGNVLFVPVKDIIVSVGDADILIDAGSAVYVMRQADRVAVFNLHDARRGGVRVEINDRYVNVHPGQEITLSRSAETQFEKVTPGRHLPFRAAHHMCTHDDITILTAEFSIPQALARVGQLRALWHSTDASDKKLAGLIVKTAAIQAHLTSVRGPFKAGSP